MATGKNQGLRVKLKIKRTSLDYSHVPNKYTAYDISFVLII